MEFNVHAIFSIYPDCSNKLLSNSGFQMIYDYAFSLCRYRKLIAFLLYIFRFFCVIVFSSPVSAILCGFTESLRKFYMFFTKLFYIAYGKTNLRKFLNVFHIKLVTLSIRKSLIITFV